MKTSINTGNPVPTAHVTVNKNRVKIYEKNNYYLKNGQTFEIELFNPTTGRVKADIYLDGVQISGGGLILKPGERIYLERFIDTNNKFLYETYEVENTEEVSRAIAKNGNLEVKFFRENIANYYWNNNFPNWSTNTVYYHTNDNNSFTLGPGNFTSNNTSTNFIDLDMMNNNTTLTNCNAVYTSMEDSVNEVNAVNLETGRIERGDASDQEFENTYGNFDTYAFKIIQYKINPVSQQPLTKEALKNVKRYCHECGTKVKVTWKHCPSCGEKL
jgi:LEA14-like dessication related protein/rubrerythrin